MVKRQSLASLPLFQEALAQFNQAIRFDKQNAAYYLERGSLYWAAYEDAEAALADTEPGEVVQFERIGYFAHDPREAMLFHRTVGLRDEWANIQKRQGR